MRAGIVVKLWLTITILVMGGLLVLGGAVVRQMERLYDFHLSEHMEGQARGLIALYQPDPSDSETAWRALEKVIGAGITLLSREELLAISQGAPSPVPLSPPTVQRLLANETVHFRAPGLFPSCVTHQHGVDLRGQDVFVTGVPLTRDGEPLGALLLCQSVTSVSREVTRFRWILFGTAAATLLGITLLALFLSRRLSRPLLEMDSMARAMAGGDFRQRVAVRGGDEIARLGDSINQMAANLDDTIRQLAANNSRLAGILTSMSDGVVLAEADGPVRFLNPPAVALARAAGAEPRDPPHGQAAGDASCLDRLGIRPAVERVLREARPLEQRVPLGPAVYHVHLRPLRDGQGRVSGAVAVWQDVTQEERLEAMRREFVANVSHELRTPISLVQGYVEALQDELLVSADQRAEALAIIREEMGRMEHLVADLLQLAHLQAGRMQFEPEPVALGPLAAHLSRKLAPLAEKTGVRVEVTVPDALPPVVADPDRLEQVLLNLLENALRYTPQGGTVTVSAETAGDRLVVRVRDQGPGVPAAERQLVWERFYRSDRARPRQHGGTGLGLAITRGIVIAHGGEVWVEDAPGGGSMFCFSLPLGRRGGPERA